MSITRADLADVDFIDAPELRADGRLFTSYRSITGLVSITAGTRRIVVPATEYLTLDHDMPVEIGDYVVIAGATGGNGTFTIDAIVDEHTFSVLPGPGGDGTGGTATFYYPAGSSKVGVDPTGRTNFSATNVQGALNQLDSAIGSGGSADFSKLILEVNGALVYSGDGDVTIREFPP